jgi:hypothetical protein
MTICLLDRYAGQTVPIFYRLGVISVLRLADYLG